MNVDLGIWDRLTRVTIFLVAIACILAVFLWYLPLIRQNEVMRKRIFTLEQQIKEKEDEARQLDGAIRALRNDPRAVERLAREKLGYIRPGETKLVFEAPITNSVAPHSP